MVINSLTVIDSIQNRNQKICNFGNNLYAIARLYKPDCTLLVLVIQFSSDLHSDMNGRSSIIFLDKYSPITSRG